MCQVFLGYVLKFQVMQINHIPLLKLLRSYITEWHQDYLSLFYSFFGYESRTIFLILSHFPTFTRLWIIIVASPCFWLQGTR